MTISKAVITHAQENGFNFYVQGCGYRALVEITDAVGNHIAWTCNKSKSALQAINTLIKQKQLDTKSNEAIAIEAPIAHAMIEEVTDSWEARHKARFANFTDADWQEHHGAQIGISDRADVQADKAANFAMSARYGCGALV